MKILRSVLERITRNIILSRNLNTHTGKRKIYISTEGGLKYLRYNIDQIDKMLYYISKEFINESDKIWDIGANVGYFTLLGASKASKGSCLSIEPDIFLSNILGKTINANKDLSIINLPIALSNQLTISKFSISKRARATNHLSAVEGSTQSGGTREEKFVPTYTLDYLLEFFEPPTFLKIDVEGAEKLVFEGASKVLSHKPKILVEVNRETIFQIKDTLLKLDYTLYDANMLPQLSLLENLDSDNILALPVSQ